MDLTRVRDSINRSHKGGLVKIVLTNRVWTPTPYGYMEQLSYLNETFPAKVSSTWNNIIQARTINCEAKCDDITW